MAKLSRRAERQIDNLIDFHSSSDRVEAIDLLVAVVFDALSALDGNTSPTIRSHPRVYTALADAETQWFKVHRSWFGVQKIAGEWIIENIYFDTANIWLLLDRVPFRHRIMQPEKSKSYNIRFLVTKFMAEEFFILDVHPFAIAHIFGISASSICFAFYLKKRLTPERENMFLVIIIISFIYITASVAYAELVTGYFPWSIPRSMGGSDVALRNSAILPAMYIPIIIMAKFLKNRDKARELIGGIGLSYIAWGTIWLIILLSAEKIQ